jgi:fructokinase
VIIVCGEALIDRIPPKFPAPSGGQGERVDSPGGGPFNTARALARLGIRTQFLGRLSTDPSGRRLRGLLSEDGVDLSLTSVGPEPTTMAMADIDRDGHAAYRFASDGTSAPNLTPQMLPASFSPDVKALHVGTLGLVFEPMATTIADLVDREHNKRLVMVDPNIRPSAVPDKSRLERIIAQSTIVKTSDADVTWLYPTLDLESAARALLARGPRLVVVTLGSAGAFALCAGTEVRVPAPPVDVVDTIGAGDTFGAALLAWLSDHERLIRDLHLDRDELRDALDFACLVASITCSRAGADPPWRRELSGPRTARTL